MEIDHTISLLAGVIYAIGALFIKRAIKGGAGVTRILVINSWIIFVLALPLLMMGDFEVHDWSRWWGPFLGSLLCFMGAVLVIIAIRTGEVSIQTPLMGTKVVFVAFFSVLILGAPIPFTWWVGAFLTCFGILVLGLPDLFKKQISMTGVVYAIASSIVFALADVVCEKEAPIFGEVAFIVVMLGMLALESLVLFPFFRKGLLEIPKSTWKWIFWGAFFMALQEVAVLWVIAYFGKVTVVNILYSARGVWSVLLIWFLGKWFDTDEGTKHGGNVMKRRLAGAVLMLIAIIIILANG